MKKFFKKLAARLRRRRNRRLYFKLFMLYVNKTSGWEFAAEEANGAFEWLTDEKWGDQF